MSFISCHMPWQAPISHEEIRLRAYFIWLRRGCRYGMQFQDWQQAEQELLHERSGSGFPGRY